MLNYGNFCERLIEGLYSSRDFDGPFNFDYSINIDSSVDLKRSAPHPNVQGILCLRWQHIVLSRNYN